MFDIMSNITQSRYDAQMLLDIYKIVTLWYKFSAAQSRVRSHTNLLVKNYTQE